MAVLFVWYWPYMVMVAVSFGAVLPPGLIKNSRTINLAKVRSADVSILLKITRVFGFKAARPREECLSTDFADNSVNFAVGGCAMTLMWDYSSCKLGHFSTVTKHEVEFSFGAEPLATFVGDGKFQTKELGHPCRPKFDMDGVGTFVITKPQTAPKCDEIFIRFAPNVAIIESAPAPKDDVMANDTDSGATRNMFLPVIFVLIVSCCFICCFCCILKLVFGEEEEVVQRPKPLFFVLNQGRRSATIGRGDVAKVREKEKEDEDNKKKVEKGKEKTDNSKKKADKAKSNMINEMELKNTRTYIEEQRMRIKAKELEEMAKKDKEKKEKEEEERAKAKEKNAKSQNKDGKDGGSGKKDGGKDNKQKKTRVRNAEQKTQKSNTVAPNTGVLGVTSEHVTPDQHKAENSETPGTTPTSSTPWKHSHREAPKERARLNEEAIRATDQRSSE